MSTVLEMCKPVGVSCGCQGENSVNRIKLNKGPEFPLFSHYKNLIDKIFYFRFAIVSLSVLFIYNAIFAIFRDRLVKFLSL